MKNLKIFVVEDEENLRNLIVSYLVKEGFEVHTAEDGREAVSKWRENFADLMILDVMMPYLNGYEVLEHIRASSDVPVIFLTAKREYEDRIKGFETGGDDYLTKPFSMKELVMRVKAILKRTENIQKDHRIIVNELTIDPDSHTAAVSGIKIDLSVREFEILHLLIKNKDIPISREQLLDRLWGIDFEGDLRVVDTAVKRLRRKLLTAQDHIKTVRGLGYKFEV
ncbi:MAG: response regulator transcription factor [Eubacteriaceae bacterium]|nr:response regulator transcription factor [Eubacteriaceae bacterium]